MSRNGKSSPLPPYLRWAGPLLAPGYGLGVRVHRAFSTPRKAPLPVICIGNLTVGGTGKTPAVKYIARGLAQRLWRPAILMRGYKGQDADEAEEVNAALADLKLPSPVIVNPDRLAGATLAKERGCDCVVLDDGFQHWALKRDLDIVLIDASDPFGGGRLLPYGRLREPVAGLMRAGVVIITRCDAVDSAELERLRAEIKRLAPSAAIATARHAPGKIRALHGREPEPPDLRGRSIVAACGIGNPNAFRRTLESLGACIADFRTFPDHHRYTQVEIDALLARTRDMKVDALVVTEKDSPKLARLKLADGQPVWVLPVSFEIVDGEGELWKRVEHALAASAAPNP